MKKIRNWIAATLVVAATAGVFALQNNVAKQPAASDLPPSETVTFVAETIDTVTATETVTFTPAYEGCAFTWAYHDAPELTKKIDEAVRAMDPNARANAKLFGEDCVYADGRSTFGVMETDIYVDLTVVDLADNELFGNWMAQVMAMVMEIPRDELQGNYGFVEFWFDKSETEHLVVRVPIQKYLDDGQGKTGEEFLQLFIETP